MKKIVSIMLALVLILGPITNVYAGSCSYTHAVECDCCGDVAMVTHRILVPTHYCVKTTLNVYSGTINKAYTYVFIKGCVGENTWGDEIPLMYSWSMQPTIDWSRFVSYVAAARANFTIVKGKSVAKIEGHWVSVD